MSQGDDWEEDPNPWSIQSVERVFENAWFVLDSHHGTNPAGKPATYTVFRPRRHAVGVVPIEANGDVHLVGQWRFALGRYSWEIPEGGADPGEAYEVTARRELAEETGLQAGSLVKILEMDLSNSITDEAATLYLATGLSQGEAQPEDVEILRRRKTHFQDVLARIADGRIRDSLTVAALLRIHHMATNGELSHDLARAVLNKGV